jgi:hypothetical protein
MRIGRWFSLPLVLAVAGPVSAQAVSLAEVPQPKDCLRVELTTRLDGERIYTQDGDKKSHKTALAASHAYTEKTLAAGTGGVKAARHYSAAQSSLTIDGQLSSATLRPERRLAVVQRTNAGSLAYCPSGPLAREEMELVSEHFDTLSLAALLPATPVNVNDTWKVSNDAVQGLCGFDGLLSHELTGRLVQVTGDRATVAVSGVAKGIELGAQVALTVTATATVDLTRKRLVALEWKQDDLRDQGPASPGFKAVVVITLKREPVPEPKELSDAALESVPPGFDVPAGMTALVYRDPEGRFELTYPRDWRLTGAKSGQTTLRLLERGDFVAQATITPWQKAEPGQHMAEKEFREAVLTSPGWQAEEVIQEGTVPSHRAGWYLYRVVARGETDGVKVVQTFFLAAGPGGEQAVVAFTCRQQQFGKLGARDLPLVEGLDFAKSR